MFSFIRNSIFIKVFWGLLGIYLLNISVDCADPNPRHIPEDLTFNDQESIVELVIETIFGFEKAFTEYDDNDSEDHNNKKDVKIDFAAFYSIIQANTKQHSLSRKIIYPNREDHLSNGYNQLHTPPPKI